MFTKRCSKKKPSKNNDSDKNPAHLKDDWAGDAGRADAGDDVGHEERHPAYDEDAHDGAQRLGGLLLLGERFHLA